MQTVTVDQHKILDIILRHYNIPKNEKEQTKVVLRFYPSEKKFNDHYGYVEYVKPKEEYNDVKPMSWAREDGIEAEKVDFLESGFVNIALLQRFDDFSKMVSKSAITAESHVAVYKPSDVQKKMAKHEPVNFGPEITPAEVKTEKSSETKPPE